MWRKRQTTAGGPERWLVLDVESSGLDASRDRLLALAAVALRVDAQRAWIELADSFEVVLWQPEDASAPDRANILVHGIGIAAQGRGRDPAQALQGFEAFVAGAPLLGFHAAFDKQLVDRATQAQLGRRLRNPWLDIADIAAVLRPEAAARTLDDWLAVCGIPCTQRHQAMADALATAELLLQLLPAARADGMRGFRDLARLAARRRWLS